MRVPDAAFADPRLAALYDVLEVDRSDLDVYEDLVDELGATSVVDIGCGTGSLAVRLAARGMTVIGIDPAGASLDIARAKPHAGQVTWVHGDATAVAALRPAADLAVMTGNVAQVFVTDDDWAQTLDAVRLTLRPGGAFVLESRRIEARAWESWNTPETVVEVPGGTSVTVSMRVTQV
ncbi:MAG TPA: class I SAM-dependent methyltransferase, partial [Actinomycetales bacterium]